MLRNQSSEIRITFDDEAPVFVAGEQPVARLAPPSVDLAEPNQDGRAFQLSVVAATTGTDVTLSYAGLGWTAHDRIARTGPRQFHCERTWHNTTSQPQEVVLSCELQHPGADPFYMIPAVSYNGNQWGGGQEPKGLRDEFSTPPGMWVFGGDRASVPACTISESDGYAVALYDTPEDASHSGCALQPVADGITHWLKWPLQEQPRTYRARDAYAAAIRSTLHLAPGESCTRNFFVAINSAPEPRQGYPVILDDAWTSFHHRVPARYTPQQLWSLGIRFAKESLWVEADEFVGFSIGLTLRSGAWVQHPHRRYEIGWCGQNAGWAAMLLQDYLWHGDEDSWQRGARVLDFWATHGQFDNGLFYTHFEEKLAGIENPDLDTCNLGHGAYHFLLASELAEKAGRPRPLWREVGLGACDFFGRHALPNGKLGRVWKADGQVKDPDGTIGCSMVWPLCKAYQMTGKVGYLQTAERAFRAYADDDLDKMRCTAGALDTDCIDKETAFPLLIAGLDLHEITGEAYYLGQAERAAYYLASWQWHYSIGYPPGTPAADMHYDTFGGTSVSVQHHHLDPWAALIALGWLRLSRATGKSIWRERATAAWCQATIGVSDGSLVLKGVVRPAGGQDEGFYHTRWGGPPGGVSDWLVAWPSAFRLITLHHWSHWDDLE